MLKMEKGREGKKRKMNTHTTGNSLEGEEHRVAVYM